MWYPTQFKTPLYWYCFWGLIGSHADLFQGSRRLEVQIKVFELPQKLLCHRNSNRRDPEEREEGGRRKGKGMRTLESEEPTSKAVGQRDRQRGRGRWERETWRARENKSERARRGGEEERQEDKRIRERERERERQGRGGSG
eukprot:2661284-Rhodomonas_salina.1